jgi:hypothetical protein
MPRHIDYSYPMPTGQIKIGKAEFNGDAAFFFLFESIRVKTRQGPNKASFPMINMAGSTKNNLAHFLVPYS